ncbi:hypothetical protein K4K60_011181 [Colletotrichum sp. SAR11_57]|nr:hypothetical protein K4K60_011181 [Colletotrichum sp. SAR11_57]
MPATQLPFTRKSKDPQIQTANLFHGGQDAKTPAMWSTTIPILAGLPLVASSFLADLPATFNDTPAIWAYVSYGNPSVAVLTGSFNRSAIDAPHKGETSDPALKKTNEFLNTTNFIAYDERFFDIFGPQATVKQVQQLAFQTHEAPCYNKDTKELYFAEWGPPGGDDGTHSWQYMLTTRNNTLKKITTTPPTVNAHGCIYYRGAYHVVTDGSHNETGALVRVNPETLERTVLLNNYYQEPFMGFNDLDIDSEGNANGVAVSSLQDGRHTLYLPDTGVSEFKPVSKKNPYGNRALFAYDVAPGGVLTSPRLLNNPISYFYDGIRVSRNGWIFVGAGDGVDVIDPVSGFTLGTIRVGGGDNLAVSLAFGEHEFWIVGRGGVWHVNNVAERLDREW